MNFLKDTHNHDIDSVYPYLSDENDTIYLYIDSTENGELEIITGDDPLSFEQDSKKVNYIINAKDISQLKSIIEGEKLNLL